MELINKDALKKDILALPNCYNGFSDTYDKACIIGVIDEQPTIEERKTGRWKDYIGKGLGIEGQWLRDDGKTVFIQCDQCDSLFVRNLMIHANFCPNCGARMEVEHD